MKLKKATVERLELPQGKPEMIVFDEGLPGFGSGLGLCVAAHGSRNIWSEYRKVRHLGLSIVATPTKPANRRRRSLRASNLVRTLKPRRQPRGPLSPVK